jgi:type IV pilus assembly protein PilO
MKKFLAMPFKEQMLVAIVSLVLITGLFYFILMRPKFAQLNEILKQEQLEEKKFSEATISFRELKKVKSETEAVEKKLEELEIKLPEKEDIPSIITDIQDIAGESSVDFVSIKPLTYIGRGAYTEIPLELTMEGRFFDLLDFLYQIEKSKRKFIISKITINPSENGLPDVSVLINSSAFMLVKTQSPPKQGN